jgi:predicted dehydrogenase
MIGIGIAGAGYFASVHAHAIATLPDFRIAAVSAGNKASTAAFAAAHGGRPCDDWRRMLDDPPVDVVLVAMPHHLHAPVTIAALQAGKHVMVEKPMAPTLDECVAMARAAVAADRKLMVAHVMRFVLPCMAARDYLASGAPWAGRCMGAAPWSSCGWSTTAGPGT